MSLLRSMFLPRAAGADQTNMQLFSVDAALGRKTLSGQNVSPTGAMQLATYYACIRALGEDVAKLPLNLYKVLPNGGKEVDLTHPLHNVLNVAASDEMTAMAFREVMGQWAAGWGNAYAEIQKDRMGGIVSLTPIHPSRVRMKRINGDLKYIVSATDVMAPGQAGALVTFDPSEILHLHGLSDDGLSGMSVARLAAESIGLTMAAQSFGASFFGNGAHPSVVLAHPGHLSEQAQRNLRESWKKMYSGPENAHMPAVVEEGLTVTPISIPPNEAQMIETRSFQREEIATWFRMPAHKVGIMSRATLNNIEHQALEYVSDTLLPWFVRWEQEIARKLMDPRDRVRYIVRHETTTLLRGDAAARSNYYRTMINAGVMTPNEARGLEHLNPVDPEQGDKLYMQGAMSTLDRIVDGTALGGPDPAQATNDANDKKATSNDPAEAGDISALAPVFAEAEARVRRKEELALGNALKKHTTPLALATWAAGFYDEHLAYVRATFAAPTAAAVAMHGAGSVAALADTAIVAYVNRAEAAAITGAQHTPDTPLAATLLRLLTPEASHA